MKPSQDHNDRPANLGGGLHTSTPPRVGARGRQAPAVTPCTRRLGPLTGRWPRLALGASVPFALTLALWLGALPGLFAQAVPDQINYQGILLQGDGTPVPAVPTDVEFRIYDNAAATSGLKWGRMFRVTPDTNGVFNVVLSGDGALLSGAPTNTLAEVFTGTGSDSRYLELTVAGSTPIRPRQRFVAAAYAFLAADARSLNQRPPEDYFLPPGMVVPFAGPTNKVPQGWLLCNGAEVSRTAYARLWDAIGTAWGHGDNSSTFRLPDLRGMFLRGVNNGRTTALFDPDSSTRSYVYDGGNSGDNVGSVQWDEFKSHNHNAGTFNILLKVDGTQRASSVTTGNAPNVWNYGTIEARGGTETRPRNAYVNYIIKY